LLRAERPNPFPRASRRRAHKFNKTTERKSSHRKTSSFYEKRRLDIIQKVENDSQITIHRTHVKYRDMEFLREILHFEETRRESNFYCIAFQAKFYDIAALSRDVVTGYSRFAR